MHWAARYTDQKWTEDHDCYYWFCRVMSEQFGKKINHCSINHSRLVPCATKILTGDLETNFGYKKTETPEEGDAVLLTQRNHPHHIGIVVWDRGIRILHAVRDCGVLVSDPMDLKVNGWRIVGYCTDAR